jgi:hypothetical protein
MICRCEVAQGRIEFSLEEVVQICEQVVESYL